jgi:LPS-assembly protein
MDGAFEYRDPTLMLTGTSGYYDDHGGSFRGARFQLVQHPGRGEADSVTETPDGHIELLQVAYTTCPPENQDWQLRAKRITLDLDRHRGVGYSTRIEFKGVPILYLPWISFPLSDQRQTGLLFPTIGTSSRNGITLSAPWYWNIAPNRDLTLTPTLFAQRGVKLDTEFRIKQAGGDARLELEYLPHDRIAGFDRSYDALSGKWELPADWRVTVGAEHVSDITYFEDLVQGPQISSTVFLPQRVDFGHRDDVWRLNAMLLQFQNLLQLPDPDHPDFCPTDTSTTQQTLCQKDRPYAQLPRFTAHGRFDQSAGLRSLFDAELVNFTRATGVTGWRGDAQPAVTWQRQGAGYYLRPSLAWDLTAYQLQNTSADRSLTRNVPIASFDSGLQFEKRVGAADSRVLTFEPRLMYVYIPYRNQDALPVFDSGLPDPNFVTLFRANRYVGGDRIGDANKLAVGFTSRMYEAATGQQYLSATLGESLNFSTPRVTLNSLLSSTAGSPLPDEVPDTSRRSSLIGTVDLQGYRHFGVHVDVAWNPETSETDKSQVTLQYREAGNRVINLGYRFDRNAVEQAEASAAWPIAKRWEVYGRSVYSLRDHQTIDSFGGLRYHSDCWGLRAVVRRSVSTRAGERDTGVYLQFELTGLSSVGTGADTFLQDSIQGYSADQSLRLP